MNRQRAENSLKFGIRKHLPLVIQSESAECGLACLAMISGFFGAKTDLVELRRRFPMSSRGINLKQLIDVASRMGLSARAVRIDSIELGGLSIPCILHWNLNHFVVLKKVSANGAIINDPAHGEVSVSNKEIDRSFTGVALELTPTEEFKPIDHTKKLRLKDFWTKIVGLKRSLGQILLLSLLLQLFVLMAPLYMQTVVDKVLVTNDENLLLVLALGFSLLLMIRSITSGFRDIVIQRFSQTLGLQMAVNVFHHLVRLPMDWFYRRHMGDIVSRFGSLKNVRELLTTGVVAAVLDGVMALITLAAMFVYDTTLGAIVVVFVLVYCLFRYVFYGPLRRAAKEYLGALAKHDSYFMETMRAAQTIKLFQREDDRQSQWQNYLAEAVNKDIQVGSWKILYRFINLLIFGVENIVVVYLAAKSIMDGGMSIGMLFAFMSFKTRFNTSINNLIEKWVQLKMLDIHLERLADIVYSPAEKVDDYVSRDPNLESRIRTERSRGLSPIEGSIEVRDLSYRYGEGESFIFENLSFSVRRGETVVITGPSGCGKTTLLKCMLGLLEPTKGQIFVDGIPLSKSPHFRSNVGVVLQGDQLLSGTIAENIACFDPKLNLRRVKDCAKLASVHDDIQRMPMRYDTLVGDMGSTLSGGQHQRLTLARALYRSPQMLFMDEATSNLDVEKETQVNEALSELDITRILTAHRPETIRMADREIRLTTAASRN